MDYKYCLIAFVIFMVSCSNSFTPVEQTEDKLNVAIKALQHSYGDPNKTDAQVFMDSCTLINPIIKWGNQVIKSGFFVGVAGEGVLGFGFWVWLWWV